MRHRTMKTRAASGWGAPTWVLTLTMLILSWKTAEAVPTFSRKYETSCVTCHVAHPKLNAFGKAFRNNGYRFPQGRDPEMTKEEPVSLGAESYKRVWPDAVWPSDIPGTSPISLRGIARAHYTPNKTPKTNFEFPHELELLYTGTLGESFSTFGEAELEMEQGELEIGFEYFLQYDYRPWLHVRIGNVSPDLPNTGDGPRLTKEHSNVVNLRSRNRWRLRDQQAGVEVSGARNGLGDRGGLTYAAGIVNGQGMMDANDEKDLYARAAYKLGGMGEAGAAEELVSETSAPYVDNSAQIGAFSYLGTVSRDGVKDEDLTVLGLTFDLWYRRANVFGALMQMNSKIPGKSDRTSLAGYAEGHYVVYPLLIPVARFEWTDVDLYDDTQKPAITLIPAVTVLPRANIKFSLEYKRPLQYEWLLDKAKERGDALVLQMDYGF